MSSARPAQAGCGTRSSVPHRARQARASAAAQSQPPQQRAASQRVVTCARSAPLRPGAPILLSKGGVLLARRRGARVVARAGDRDEEPVTATQEIPIFPLGLCAHPMGEGAGRTHLKTCTCGGTAPRPRAARCGTQRRPLGAPVHRCHGVATRAAGTLRRAGSPAPLVTCACSAVPESLRLFAVFQCL